MFVPQYVRMLTLARRVHVAVLCCFVAVIPASYNPPPCIIMSSDPPPRRSSRLSNKRTVVPNDGIESVAMTFTKRRGKRTDAGRRHTMTCTFVSDVLRIMYDTVSSRHSIRKNSVQCMHGGSMQRCYEMALREICTVYYMHTLSKARHASKLE